MGRSLCELVLLLKEISRVDFKRIHDIKIR